MYLKVFERQGEHVHVSDAPLPESTRKDKEVNCSLEKTGWKLVLYSEHHDADEDECLYAGDMVSLYEPELKAFMRLQQHAKLDARYAALFELTAEGERADSNALWLIEQRLPPAVGGKLVYQESVYRLRHLNSGRYLQTRSSSLWAAGVRKVVLITSILTDAGAWGQRDSAGDKVTNAFGNVLEEKVIETSV